MSAQFTAVVTLADGEVLRAPYSGFAVDVPIATATISPTPEWLQEHVTSQTEAVATSSDA